MPIRKGAPAIACLLTSAAALLAGPTTQAPTPPWSRPSPRLRKSALERDADLELQAPELINRSGVKAQGPTR